MVQLQPIPLLKFDIMYKCKYCGKEFEGAHLIGGHTSMCKLNPNYKETIKTRSEILKQASISSNQIKFSKKHGELKLFEVICKKCGKKFRQTSRNKKYCSLECYLIAKVTDSNKPSVLELLKDFKLLKSFVQVGKKYNVTDNAVRKWCKLYKIPTTSKEMKEYIKNM